MHRCYASFVMEDLIIQNFVDQDILLPNDDIIAFLAKKAQERYIKKSYSFNKDSRKIIKKCSAEYVISEYLAHEMTHI